MAELSTVAGCRPSDASEVAPGWSRSFAAGRLFTESYYRFAGF